MLDFKRGAMTMQNNVYEVLMYIVGYYMKQDLSHVAVSQFNLACELAEVGFEMDAVQKAFTWLASLTEENQLETKQIEGENHSVRIYATSECERLSLDSRGFLLLLEQNKIISPLIRERIIDRALALGIKCLHLDQLKWVTLMVLFNRNDSVETMEWIKDLVFEENNHVPVMH